MASELGNALQAKQIQWGKESLLAAMHAAEHGLTAELVIYPTGLKRMRYAKPFTTYGMNYEVAPEIWEMVTDGTAAKFYRENF